MLEPQRTGDGRGGWRVLCTCRKPTRSALRLSVEQTPRRRVCARAQPALSRAARVPHDPSHAQPEQSAASRARSHTHIHRWRRACEVGRDAHTAPCIVFVLGLSSRSRRRGQCLPNSVCTVRCIGMSHRESVCGGDSRAPRSGGTGGARSRSLARRRVGRGSDGVSDGTEVRATTRAGAKQMRRVNRYQKQSIAKKNGNTRKIKNAPPPHSRASLPLCRAGENGLLDMTCRYICGGRRAMR